MKNQEETKLCKHCKTEIPNGAKICPNCKKKQGLSGCLIVIIAVIVIGIIGAALGGSGNKNNSSQNNSSQSSQQTYTENNTTQKSENDIQEPEIQEPEPEVEPELTTYEASTYKVGSDIPSGEYVIFRDGISGYFEISSDSNGSLSSIIANDNLTYNSLVILQDGQYFKMTSCYAVPLDENPFVETTGNGMFKIGTHLEAGEYEIEVDKNSYSGYGYVEVSSDSSHSLNSIISNDNFEGSTYITVNDGQYLKLSGCHIVK